MAAWFCQVRVVSALIVLLIAGCTGHRQQSALHPSGPAAERIAWLWWILLTATTIVFVLVLLALFLAVFRRRASGEQTPPLGNRFIVITGIVLPAVILFVMLIFSLNATVALREPETDLTIRVVGHQWWWEVHYPDHGITTANELYVPAGRPVKLELESADVIHSFWVPNLTGKRDMNPGLTTTFWLQADAPGTYRGQCAEFCGIQHALMAFLVVALPNEEFDDWIDEKRRPRREPMTAQEERGREVYFEAACQNCHAIRGTRATGRIGPDLTHIGSRLTLGAATIPNNHGHLAGWIVNPGPLKPGNRMPPSYIGPQDLHDLLAYLNSLQ